jgi:hypothetical protein
MHQDIIMFFERFASDRGSQRLGKDFPYNPDVQPDKVGSEIEKIANWTFGSLLPYWVFKLMRAEARVRNRERTRVWFDIWSKRAEELRVLQIS